MQNKCRSIFTEIATCFGVGNLTAFPGTIGSIVAFLFFPLVVLVDLSIISILAISMLLFILGVCACHQYEVVYSVKDPKNVVLDEFVAQIMLILFINYIFQGRSNSAIFILCVLSFFLFRFLDILKPWPISIAQKNIQGGFGVMFDDLMAAIGSLIILLVVYYVSL